MDFDFKSASYEIFLKQLCGNHILREGKYLGD